MYFVDDIAIDYLRQSGFLGAIELRKIKNCVWYKVRRGDEFFEAEVYGPAYSKDDDLKKYIASLREFKGNKFYRVPVKLFAKKNYTFIIREFLQSEPIYKTLMRSGSVEENDAITLLKNSTLFLESISSLNMNKFSPLVLMMQVNPTYELFLDGLRCGPWVKDFEEVNVIYDYLNPELTWNRQILYFKNKYMLKVFAGSPHRLTKSNFQRSDLNDYLLNIQNDPENYSEQLDGLFASEVNPFKKQDQLLLIILAISFFVSLAIYKRSRDNSVTWEGEATSLNMVYEETKDLKEPLSENFSTEAVDIEDKLQELQQLLKMESLLHLAYFEEYKSFVGQPLIESLSDEGKAFLQKLDDQFVGILKNDFVELNRKVDQRVIVFEFQEARSLLTASIKRYHDSDEKSKMISRLYDLDKLEQKHELQEALDKQKALKLKAKELQLIIKVEEIIARKVEDYRNDFLIKVRQLVVIESELKTPDARQLIEFYIELIQNKQRMFSSILNQVKVDKVKLYRYINENVDGMRTVEIVKISNVGFEYRDAAGGSTLKFSELRADRLYGLFLVALESQEDEVWFALHDYLVTEGWLEQVKDLVQKRPDLDFSKNEDKFIGVAEARQRLFSDD